MATNNQIVERAAAALGMRYDSKQLVGYGVVKGFTMLIKPCAANSRENVISLLLCASNNGQAADREIIASKGLPKGVNYKIEGFVHCFDVKVTFKADDVIGKLTEMAEMASSALTEAGYVNCNFKGVESFTEVYIFKDNYVFLSDADASDVRSELGNKKLEYDEIVENKALGVIGALVGSLAGVLVILLIGRLGRVSMLGGIIMGAASIFCYKKLGHKLSSFGAAICTVISVVMSYLAFRIDASIDLVNIFKEIDEEIDFLFCLINTKYLFELGEALDTYYMNLVMMLLGGVGGAAAMIWGDRKTTKNGFELIKIGE